MGKERDRLIRRYGGVPVSEEGLSDEELMARRLEHYRNQGRLPPEIEALRAGQGVWVVGYGTLLSRSSLSSTVGEGVEGLDLEPVVVRGYRRVFNLRPSHYEPSYRLTEEPTEMGAMNVQEADGAFFNGLRFRVSPEALGELDERERYYDRREVDVEAFPDGPSLGPAFVYSAGPSSPWVVDDLSELRPHWRDIVLARQGAYAVSRAFGRMFDETTYLAGGRELVIHEYREHLPDPTAA